MVLLDRAGEGEGEIPGVIGGEHACNVPEKNSCGFDIVIYYLVLS
jgi:hypothetical protein